MLCYCSAVEFGLSGTYARFFGCCHDSSFLFIMSGGELHSYVVTLSVMERRLVVYFKFLEEVS